MLLSCFRYHKGTDFQANHNIAELVQSSTAVVLDTTKVQIFKQITTGLLSKVGISGCFRYHKGTDFQANHNLQSYSQLLNCCCFRYHKGTDFQANHNKSSILPLVVMVVLDTTKVQIFKQITTIYLDFNSPFSLFQIPQRYRFSSKSQRCSSGLCCCHCCFRYHKGTDFQANHNYISLFCASANVVLDTTKVQIFKQITTIGLIVSTTLKLFQIPQRYRFSSKSQPPRTLLFLVVVVLDTTKVQIFKQITTRQFIRLSQFLLFQIPQRYRFSSKSQQNINLGIQSKVVLDTTKVQIFKQITTLLRIILHK